MVEVKDRVLSEEQKKKILEIVHGKMAPDDRYPYEVCTDRYGDDHNAYCLAMVKWRNIDLESL